MGAGYKGHAIGGHSVPHISNELQRTVSVLSASENWYRDPFITGTFLPLLHYKQYICGKSSPVSIMLVIVPGLSRLSYCKVNRSFVRSYVVSWSSTFQFAWSHIMYWGICMNFERYFILRTFYLCTCTYLFFHFNHYIYVTRSLTTTV
jgi:hypothetical protein